MNKIVIALDGYSGTGKSTTAKMVADELDYIFIDSGAMYRAVTYYFILNKVELTDEQQVNEALASCEIYFGDQGIMLNGHPVESYIRSMEVSQLVSPVSAISSVRRELVQLQQKMGQSKGIVMDGRDIGTVVFPEAELKIFMTASMDVRVERRLRQLSRDGIQESKEDIRQNLTKRDKIDSTREDSPLKMAEDAVEIDTSLLTLESQTKKIVEMARAIIS